MDSILASFTKTAERLEAAAERHAREALEHAAAEYHAGERKVEARFQAARARIAASNIRDLFESRGEPYSRPKVDGPVNGPQENRTP